MTGRLLPSGNVVDELEVRGVGSVTATLIDAANPCVLVAASDLGCTGTELPSQLNGDGEVLARFEAIRASAAVAMGLAASVEEAARDASGQSESGDGDRAVLASGRRRPSDRADRRRARREDALDGPRSPRAARDRRRRGGRRHARSRHRALPGGGEACRGPGADRPLLRRHLGQCRRGPCTRRMGRPPGRRSGGRRGD